MSVMILDKLKRQDHAITIIALLLGFTSLAVLFSIEINFADPFGSVIRQTIFFAIGFGAYFGISLLDISWFKERTVSWGVYVFILLTLFYTLLFGDVIAQTQRWIVLGPFSFQPAEFAKLAIVILTAYLLTRDEGEVGQHRTDARNWKPIIVSALTAGLFAVLIFLQPSLGNALIFTVVWAVTAGMRLPAGKQIAFTFSIVAIAAGAYYQISIFSGAAEGNFFSSEAWKVLVLVGLGALLAALRFFYRFNSYLLIGGFIVVTIMGPLLDFSWNNVLRPYHRTRVEAYLDGFSSDPLDRDFQVRQSLATFGSGQLTGTGYLGPNTQNLNALPFAQTDFIFAAFGKQFGHIGVIVLFSLYALLIYRGFLIGLVTTSEFAKITAVGILAVISTNILVNTAMNQGMIPVTGVPLPLMSYGGSSILLIMICLGILQSIKISTKASDFSRKIAVRKLGESDIIIPN